jgi:hypothetical protein
VKRNLRSDLASAEKAFGSADSVSGYHDGAKMARLKA